METIVENLLVVDDEAGIREVVLVYLEDHITKIWQASNLSEAKEIIEKNEIDLLVLDVHLGDENGGELIAWLKKKKVIIPTLSISGFFTKEFMSKNENKVSMLAKPFDQESLLNGIINLLAHHRSSQDIHLNKSSKIAKEKENKIKEKPKKVQSSEFLKNLTKK